MPLDDPRTRLCCVLHLASLCLRRRDAGCMPGGGVGRGYQRRHPADYLQAPIVILVGRRRARWRCAAGRVPSGPCWPEAALPRFPPPLITPCLRFSRTRLSQAVDRPALGVAVVPATGPRRGYRPSVARMASSWPSTRRPHAGRRRPHSSPGDRGRCSGPPRADPARGAPRSPATARSPHPGGRPGRWRGRWPDLPVLHHACLQPRPQQLQHPPIPDPLRHQVQELRVVARSKNASLSASTTQPRPRSSRSAESPVRSTRPDSAAPTPHGPWHRC